MAFPSLAPCIFISARQLQQEETSIFSVEIMAFPLGSGRAWNEPPQTEDKIRPTWFFFLRFQPQRQVGFSRLAGAAPHSHPISFINISAGSIPGHITQELLQSSSGGEGVQRLCSSRWDSKLQERTHSLWGFGKSGEVISNFCSF